MAPSVCILKQTMGAHGGLEKYTSRLAHAFALRGCPVTILSSSSIAEQMDEQIFYRPVPLKRKVNFLKIREYDALCRHITSTGEFDIVFGMDRNRSQTHLRAGNGVHAAYLEKRVPIDSLLKRLSHTVNPLHQTLLSIEKEAFESEELRLLFTNSQMVREEILHHYNTDPDKIHVVHNGVEWKEMEHDFSTWVEQKNRIAHSLGLDPTTYHFLFVGHGFKRKGLEPLLRALSKLSSCDFHLSVIGKDKQQNDFINLSQKLKLKHKVTFFGKRTDVRKFYQLADTLVIPSYYDPFANVTVEALAMGLFVVTSPNNGGKEVIKSHSGIVLPTLSDEDAFVYALSQAIERPKTWIGSQKIRDSVKHLDFSNQLRILINSSIQSIKSYL